MFSIDEETNTITLTRGDTGEFTVSLKNADGEPYTPMYNDELSFIVSTEKGGSPILTKKVKGSNAIEILPDDTKGLAFGTYYYDLQIKLSNGKVDTFVNKAKLKVGWEAGD